MTAASVVRLSFRLIHPRPEPFTAVRTPGEMAGTNGPERPRIKPC